MTKTLYAIGLKDYIQIRAADKPPNKHQSEVVRPVKEYRDNWVYEFGPTPVYGRWKTQIITRNVKISITYYTGGRIILTMKRRLFRKLTKVSVKDSDMKALSPIAADVILAYRNRK